jgi:hypothetical protein
MKNIVRINIDSKMDDLELNIENRSIINILNKNSNNRGSNNIRHLYTWINNKDTVKCYGWYDGNEEYINKHELMPNGSSKFLDDDSSTILLYGDIFMICYDDKTRIKDFSVSDYAMLNDIINDGFDECLSDDSEDSEPDTEEEDQDYECNGSDEDNDFEIIDNDNELDEDNNEY